jgi:hypothetical protein
MTDRTREFHWAGADVSPVPDGERHFGYRRFYAKRRRGMVHVIAGPIYVALIQTASSLPFLSSLCRQDPTKVAYLILFREFSL